MDERKEEIIKLIMECNNAELVEYLYKWVLYSIIYYQKEKD